MELKIPGTEEVNTVESGCCMTYRMHGTVTENKGECEPVAQNTGYVLD